MRHALVVLVALEITWCSPFALKSLAALRGSEVTRPAKLTCRPAVTWNVDKREYTSLFTHMRTVVVVKTIVS